MTEPKAPVCPNCGKTAVLEDNIKIYISKSYGKSWICPGYPDCNTYVGSHKKTGEPLGTMADANLRDWRKRAHAAFDMLWKGKPKPAMPRKEAYIWMQQMMGMTEVEAHIGHFTVEQCEALVEKVRAIWLK